MHSIRKLLRFILLLAHASLLDLLAYRVFMACAWYNSGWKITVLSSGGLYKNWWIDIALVWALFMCLVFIVSQMVLWWQNLCEMEDRFEWRWTCVCGRKAILIYSCNEGKYICLNGRLCEHSLEDVLIVFLRAKRIYTDKIISKFLSFEWLSNSILILIHRYTSLTLMFSTSLSSFLEPLNKPNFTPKF